MELDYCGEEKLQEPSLDQVFDRLEKLTDDVNSFLILAHEEQRFMQAAKSERGYYIEYREGLEDEHYSTPRNDLALSEAKKVFELYYRGDPAFQEAVEFKPGVLGPKHGCLAALLLVALLWLLG